LNSEEGFLFQYLLSDEFLFRGNVWLFPELTRKFVAGYGGQLPSSSLRHALLALAITSLPLAPLENKLEDYKSVTCRELIKKDYETVDDADLLATNILWWITEDLDQRVLHTKGALSILTALTSNTTRPNTLQTVFRLFRPLFEDSLHLTAIGPGRPISHQMIPTCATSFRDRVECYYELSVVDTNVLYYENTQLIHLFSIYLSMLEYLELSLQRTKNGVTGCDASLESSIVGIKDMLKWNEYRRVCEIYDALGCGAIGMEETNPEAIITCILDLSVRFQLTLFDSTSIFQALQTSESIDAASKLIAFIQLLESERYFSDTQLNGLQMFRYLGGLALSHSTGNYVSKIRCC
jgi:hypothetical protein